MIDTSAVTDAVLGRVRAALAVISVPVGDGRAPDGAGDVYGVVEVLSGPGSDGDMDDPEREAVIRYRLTAVSRDTTGAASVDGARVQAEHIAWRLRSALLGRATPLTGTGWRVTERTHVSTSGAMRDGATVNVADDVELYVVPLPGQ